MNKKFLKIILLLFAVCLLGVGVFVFFDNWKEVKANPDLTTTYTFVGVTSPSSGDIAYEKYGAASFTGPNDTGNGEATQGDYDNIESTNDARWTTDGASEDGHYDSQLYKFYINEDESVVTQLDFSWEGYGETHGTGYPTSLYAWNYNTSAWDLLQEVTFTSEADQALTGSKTTDAGNYIDTNKEVTLMTKTKRYIPPPEEGSLCYDGVDNDADNDTDCDDLGCAGAHDTGSGVYIYCEDNHMWAETASTCYLLAAAINYCNNLTYAGFSDWTLPPLAVVDASCDTFQCGQGGDTWDDYSCNCTVGVNQIYRNNEYDNVVSRMNMCGSWSGYAGYAGSARCYRQ